MNHTAIPPYPEFTWGEFFWMSSAKLDSWKDLLDADTSRHDRIRMVFAPEGRDDSPVTENEMMLTEWIIDHEEEIYAQMMDAILSTYPAIRQELYEYYDPEDAAEVLPQVSKVTDLLTLLSIQSINSHPIDTDAIPFFGVELACSWDEEHGLGVLMHGTRVLEIGGANTAILLWKAEEYI